MEDGEVSRRLCGGRAGDGGRGKRVAMAFNNSRRCLIYPGHGST